MVMINSIYNYYLTTYANTSLQNKSTHKKSELRDVYNNIVKISKHSPLYKFDVSEDTQRLAIDIKESAYALKDVSEALEPDSLYGMKKKKASSSDEDKVSAKYIGNDSSDNNKDFNIQVKQLATPQINTGNFLSQNKMSLPRGSYSFDINIEDYSYELQFKVNDTDTNRSLQDKLSRLINRSDLGLTAGVIENSIGNSSLQLTSVNTGLGFRSEIFSIDNNIDNPGDIVDYLGLNQITTRPANAEFLLNGMEKSASSNTFTVDKCFEITLNDSTGDDTVHVGFKPDFDSLVDSLNDFCSKYNSIVDLAGKRAGNSGDSSRLMKELNTIVKRHKSNLESTGLRIDENSHLSVDYGLVTQAVSEGTIKDSLDVINRFKKDLTSQANNMTINPMNYVDKTMISYPHPVKPFSDPYKTSIYTGMMFNGYV